MAIETDVKLKPAFHGKTPETGNQHEVPERIKSHAPKPVLRPGGNMAGSADAVDRAAREEREFLKFEKDRAARKAKRREKMSKAFRKSAKLC